MIYFSYDYEGGTKITLIFKSNKHHTTFIITLHKKIYSVKQKENADDQ